MAYLITKRSPEGVTRETAEIASMRIPELVADLIQEMNPTIPRDGAFRVAEDLRESDRAIFGGDTFTAVEC